MSSYFFLCDSVTVSVNNDSLSSDTRRFMLYRYFSCPATISFLAINLRDKLSHFYFMSKDQRMKLLLLFVVELGGKENLWRRCTGCWWKRGRLEWNKTTTRNNKNQKSKKTIKQNRKKKPEGQMKVEQNKMRTRILTLGRRFHFVRDFIFKNSRSPFNGRISVGKLSEAIFRI